MVLDLDDVDRGILYALQENARDATAAEMGDNVGVSASTVLNRIERLEATGVIRGYHPDINYEQAGFQLHVFIACRAPPAKRAELAQQALDLSGVVRVRELMTGAGNIHIEAIAVDSDGADELIEGIDTLGLELVSSDIVIADYAQPFDHFGQEVFRSDSKQ